MRWYLVTLEGGPIPFPSGLEGIDQPIGLAGFVTTRKARAETVQEAESLAIQDAISELRESLLEQSAESPPCRAFEIRTLTWIEAARRHFRGFTFYSWPATH
jgi:hypothetical protein